MRVAAWLLLLSAVAGYAAPPASPPRAASARSASPGMLRLQEVERLAVQRDPLLPALRAAVGVARAGRQAAGLWRDPEARVTYGSNTRQEDGDDLGQSTPESSSDYQWSLRIYPPNPWETGAKISGAEAKIHAAQARLLAGEWEALSTARRLFVEVIQAERRCDLLNRQAEIDAARKRLTDELKARGEVTLDATVEADLALVDAKAKRWQAEECCRVARRALATRLGMTPEEVKLAPVEDSLPPEPAPLEILLQRSARRPDLAALEWDRVAAEAGIREAKSARIPWFSHLQGTHDEEDRPNRRPETGWSVQAAITVPIFSQSDRKVAESVAQERLAAEKARAALRQSEAVLRDAHASWLAARTGYGTFVADTQPVIEALRKDLAVVERQTGLQPDLALKLRADLLRTESILLDARSACETAFQSLEQAVGPFVMNPQPPAATPVRPAAPKAALRRPPQDPPGKKP